MAKQAEPAATVHVARVILDGKDPVEFTAASALALEGAIAAWCRDYWQDRCRCASGDFPVAPPKDDAEVISIYFHEADGESLESAVVDLEPLPGTGALSDEKLVEAYASLDTLTLTVVAQRATIGRALLRRIEARQALGSQEPLGAEGQRQVKRLLTAIALEEAARNTAQRAALDHARASVAAKVSEDEKDSPGNSDEEIHERIVGELTHRRLARRIRWTRQQLERIVTLNEQSPEPLAPDERALREAVSVNARALIDARRLPKADDDPDGLIVQVAYLMPVEVLVDLDQQRVTRVVGIDEGIDLDPVQGAREQSTLNPLPLECAARAIAIAEEAAVWPGLTFGS
jgi:hypothetical protein